MQEEKACLSKGGGGEKKIEFLTGLKTTYIDGVIV